MSLAIDVQFNQAALTWPELRDGARAAEAAGFGAVWVFDHLAGQSLDGDHMLEAFTLLGALAASTDTIELGTMVANVNNRTPALLGVAAATVDAISDRRFHLGIGAGGSPDSRWSAEMHAIGQPIEPTVQARHGVLGRTLDTLDRLWSEPRELELATFPLPHRRPIVVIGVSGAALAELAGRRADGINVAWDHPRRDELFDTGVAARGQRDGFLLTTWTRWDEGLLDPEHPIRRAMAQRGIDRLILLVPADTQADRIAEATPIG